MMLFDLDGTLIDSNLVWRQIDLDFFAARGLTLTEDYEQYVTHATYDDAAAYTQRRYHLPESPEEIKQIWADMANDAYANRIPLKPYAAEFLRARRAEGQRLAIVTFCMRHLCRAVLERHGIAELFEDVTTVNEVGRDKSAPDIWLLAAEKAKAAPADCVVFEDSPRGAAGAKAAGMRTVGVYDPLFAGQADELRRICDRYITGFSELM